MTQVEYLKLCIRDANRLLKILGYSMHYDENFNPELRGSAETSTSGVTALGRSTKATD